MVTLCLKLSDNGTGKGAGSALVVAMAAKETAKDE